MSELERVTALRQERASAGDNSAEYWASVFREQHVVNVDGVLELGRRFEECEELAGDGVLDEAGKSVGYHRTSRSQILQIRLHADSRFVDSIKPRLPSGWGTLYLLTRLDDDEWRDAVSSNAIHPAMTQADAKKLRRPTFSEPPDIDTLPAGVHDLIYADPPWRYEHVKTESRAIENQYPTMALDEICALNVASVAHENCVLFLWATSPKLAESMQVVDAWGFTYRTCMVWVKDKIGMGYYARQRHELLLIATCGEPGAPATDARPDSVIEAPRLRHSAKPESVYATLEMMYPNATRLELFSRAPRAGWSAWGSEADVDA